MQLCEWCRWDYLRAIFILGYLLVVLLQCLALALIEKHAWITSPFSCAGMVRSVHLPPVCLHRHMDAADCYVPTVGVLKPFNKASWACVGFCTAAFSSTSADLPVRCGVLSFLNNTSLFIRLLIYFPILLFPPSKRANLIFPLKSLSHPHWFTLSFFIS